MSNKTCIVLSGPTAVGKTAMAIELALHFNTSILSTDSRQCYRELNIGVAKPDNLQLATVPHHFINSHSIHEEVNAAVFESYGLRVAQEVFRKHDILVVVGGTGLYTRAFCEGLDPVPAVPATIREGILHRYEQAGREWLEDAIKKEDPDYFENGEMKNPRRMLRALEVKRGTGKSIRYFQQGSHVQRDFNIRHIGLEMERALLYSQINKRVDAMLAQGLEAEAGQLYIYKHRPALQTVGYQELFHRMDGLLSLEQAVEQIKTHTRQYAKRQMTWFKRQFPIHWFMHPFNTEEIVRKCV